jgi:uncharacterized membrane protein YqiK
MPLNLTIPLLVVGAPLGLLLLAWLLGARYIPHDQVGVVEKLWALRGGLAEGRIIALDGEAGYQAEILRGGVHWLYFPWQYRIHREPLVTIAESKLGYVYARDGAPLTPMQTLGRVAPCTDFQDARAFLEHGGQRGRQRGLLREGVYAVNTALLVVITETRVYSGNIQEKDAQQYHDWRQQLGAIHGFDPVVIGEREARGQGGDDIGVVTVHDGVPIESGEIIAPEVKGRVDLDHEYFQNPEAFLQLGGRRGRQLQVITDGTFFLNRWFATVEHCPKTLIPIGYVGVVVSYCGGKGQDVTGDSFRYGEQVEAGRRGVWKRALPPGKYALNPYALAVELVPTVNFVLRWITGQTEAHQYDKELCSIEIITADGYEPELPLSLVLHIDYERAPSVVQRFGDVKRLISQTLDPILSAYFRDVAQSTHMLDLLTKREEIQRHATEELGRRFAAYDINCVAVLIGRPASKQTAPGADPIDQLFDQLRQRRLAEEQVATYHKREQAALTLKELHHAEALAEQQTELTQTAIAVEIAGNRGEAQLAEARRLAERDVVRADGESRSRELLGKGEAARVAEVGTAEAAVLEKKNRAYGDPRLFAVNMACEKLSHSEQPLVPERLFVTAGAAGGSGLVGQLMTLLLAERSSLGLDATAAATEATPPARPAEAEVGLEADRPPGPSRAA